MDFNTECIHAGYQAGNGQPRTLPIALSTTYPYDSCEQVHKLLLVVAETAAETSEGVGSADNDRIAQSGRRILGNVPMRTATMRR